jgi:hypothetical protein
MLRDLFNKIFKKTKKPFPVDLVINKSDEEFMIRFERVKELYAAVLNSYYDKSCQCAYPRFQQIVGIDCSDTGDSYKCLDTDLLIRMISVYFDTSNSDLTDEVKNEKWTCKICGSTYEYGWSDLSIYVERQKLKLTNLKTQQIGQAASLPIPIYLGLWGHTYPPRSAITGVSFEEFEKYLTEN